MIIADIADSHPDKITLSNVPLNYKELCNTIPSLNWDRKGDVWRSPLGWANYLALYYVFGEYFTVGPRFNQWINDEINNRINPANEMREALDFDGDSRLYPHQRAGVEFLVRAKQAILADDMGLGKSRTAFTAILEHYKKGVDVFPTLIVCPNSTKMGWAREVEEVWPGLEVVVVGGSAAQRKKQLATSAHVYIMNWESMSSHSRLESYGNVAFKKCLECGGKDPKVKETKCQVHDKELNLMDFKSVIADEVHRIKTPDSQQTRAFKYATRGAEIRIALSGTPIANHPGDLWSSLNWVSPNEFPSKSKWVERMLDHNYDIYGAIHVAGVKTTRRDEFFSSLNPRLRRMPKDLVLTDLPPLVREVRHVEMTPKQRKAYNEMCDNMIALLDEDSDALVVTDGMIKTGRLLQFASSFAEAENYTVFDEKTGEDKVKTKVTLIGPSNKVKAFMDDLPDFGDSQIVVFAQSSQLINLLAAEMDKHDLKYGLITGEVNPILRQDYMDRFQAGDLKYMLCTVGAGGTGITLTAADTAVFLQRPWSMIDSEQAEARVRRIGSDIHESITIIDYVSTGTIDTVVIEALEKKSNLLQEILRDKELMKKVLESNSAQI